MIERRFHVKPLYPGSFFSEEGEAIRIDNPGTAVALDAVDPAGWFALEVTDAWWQRWSTDEGDVEWRPCKETVATPVNRHRIYRGTTHTLAEVESWGNEFRTLAANMRGNGWDPIVKTRRGNYQPVEDRDVVLP